ncbi:MAG: hypothetical protein F6K31_07120 [Symploca sp. SIO2G7]|nr:hypothetical protein [Symploca sp. SIO2G7]
MLAISVIGHWSLVIGHWSLVILGRVCCISVKTMPDMGFNHFEREISARFLPRWVHPSIAPSWEIPG